MELVFNHTNIVNIVSLWILGRREIYVQNIDENVYNSQETINNVNRRFYNTILSEIQNQLNTTDEALIEEQLGELIVYLDKNKLIAYIENSNLINSSSSSDNKEEDLEEFAEDYSEYDHYYKD